ncbi:MAG: DUF4301 family protein, partial [Bryobacterales bacterium]|nr:DUF4301 family protein [Bryobacterales bacterium]
MVIANTAYARTISEAFHEQDIAELRAIGKSAEDAAEELHVLRGGPRPLDLARPCTAGDGVLRLDDEEARDAARVYWDDAWRRQISKFIVAAGSASRMFQMFETGDEDQTRLFCERLPELALFPMLDAAMRKRGADAVELACKGDWRPLADVVMSSDGLGMAELPKGLMPFHAYPDGVRTPLEEHVAEAVRYAAGYGNRVHVHAVVASEHADQVCRHLEGAGRKCQTANLRVKTDVSVQSSSSRTVALDAQGELLRDEDGALVLRPAGHGATLENLNALHGDIVFVRTVDNVLPDEMHTYVSSQKRVLAGVLLQIEAKIHACLTALSRGETSDDILREGVELLTGRLGVALPATWDGMARSERRGFLFERLNRPLRVCAVIPNGGHPGGAPVWIKTPEGERLRIVDKPEVDLDDKRSRSVWESAAYFNTADIVCSLRDFRGRPFDLMRFQAADEWYV